MKPDKPEVIATVSEDLNTVTISCNRAARGLLHLMCIASNEAFDSKENYLKNPPQPGDELYEVQLANWREDVDCCEGDYLLARAIDDAITAAVNEVRGTVPVEIELDEELVRRSDVLFKKALAERKKERERIIKQAYMYDFAGAAAYHIPGPDVEDTKAAIAEGERIFKEDVMKFFRLGAHPHGDKIYQIAFDLNGSHSLGGVFEMLEDLCKYIWY